MKFLAIMKTFAIESNTESSSKIYHNIYIEYY